MNGFNISNEDVNAHYIYNGNSWTQKDPLPRAMNECSSVVYNEKIHVIGGYSTRYDTLYNDHFVYDGSSWDNKADLPMGGICRAIAIIYDGKIHLIGGYTVWHTLYTHYTYDGETWSLINSKIPLEDPQCMVNVVYDNKIHLLGGGFYGGRNTHYVYDGESWSLKESRLPVKCNMYNASAINYNNKIYLFVGDTCYTYDGESWTLKNKIPNSYYIFVSVVYNNAIHLMGGNTVKHYSIIPIDLYKEVI